MYCILYTVYCPLLVVYCILYTVYCPLSTVYCRLYTLYSTTYTVYGTLYTLYTVYCILYTAYCPLYNVYCILYTVHCLLYTVHCSYRHYRRAGCLDRQPFTIIRLDCTARSKIFTVEWPQPLVITIIFAQHEKSAHNPCIVLFRSPRWLLFKDLLILILKCVQ